MPYDPAYDPSAWEEARKPRKPRWYGWQTLTTDGAALTLMVMSAQQEQSGNALAALGLGAYALGGPIVHMAHGRAGAGMASLGMRIGAPIVGAAIGSAMANCPEQRDDEYDRDTWCGVGEMAVGVLVGAGSAIAIDAALLAREPSPPRERVAARPRLSPGVALTPEKRALVLTGTF